MFYQITCPAFCFHLVFTKVILCINPKIIISLQTQTVARKQVIGSPMHSKSINVMRSSRGILSSILTNNYLKVFSCSIYTELQLYLYRLYIIIQNVHIFCISRILSPQYSAIVAVVRNWGFNCSVHKASIARSNNAVCLCCGLVVTSVSRGYHARQMSIIPPPYVLLYSYLSSSLLVHTVTSLQAQQGQTHQLMQLTHNTPPDF